MSQYERLVEVGPIVTRPVMEWNKKDLLRGYTAPLSQYIPHGPLGMLYVAWTAAIFLFNMLIISGIVQVGFFRVLIPTSIEAGVVVVSLVILFVLVRRALHNWNILGYATKYRNDSDQGRKDLSFRNVFAAITSSHNVMNDLALFVAGAIFLIPELCIMIVQATSATVTPNLNPNGGPASTIVFNDGKLENFKLPLGPNANGTFSIYYLLHFWILVKTAVLLVIYFNPIAIMAIRRSMYKFSRIADGADLSSPVPAPKGAELKELAARNKAPMV